LRRAPTVPTFPYTTLFRSTTCFKSKTPRYGIGPPKQERPKWDHGRHRRVVDVARVDASGRRASARFTFCPAADPHRCKSKQESRSEEHTSELQSLRHLVCR